MDFEERRRFMYGVKFHLETEETLGTGYTTD